MSNEGSVEPWLIADTLSFVLSLASPVAVVPIWVVGGCWLLILAVVQAMLGAALSVVVGDIATDVLGGVFLLVGFAGFFLLSSYLAHPGRWGEHRARSIVGDETAVDCLARPVPGGAHTGVCHRLGAYRPAGVPKRRGVRLWWGVLPVGVVLAVTAGLFSNPPMMRPAAFLGLFGLLVFGGVLVADRTLTLVRAATDQQTTMTLTTVFVGYVLVAGIFEGVLLTFEQPGFLYDQLVGSEGGWAGLTLMYIAPLLLILVVFTLAGPNRLGLTDIDISDRTLPEFADESPLLFDAGTGEGMFTALAIALVGIPTALGVVETTWRSRHQILSYASRRRQFSNGIDRVERGLDTAREQMEAGRHEQAAEVLIDEVEPTLRRCRQLARESHGRLSVPASVETRYDSLYTEWKRHDAVADIDAAVAEQEQVRTAYRQERETGNLEQAAALLDEAEDIAAECARHADGLDIEYSLPLSPDDIEAERQRLDRQRTESRLRDRAEQFREAVESAVRAVHDGDLEAAASAVETAEREHAALDRLEATHDEVTAPLDPDERDLVSRVRAAVGAAVEARFDTDITGTFVCDGSLFWPEASARYRFAAASAAAENENYEQALDTVETVQTALAETLKETSDADKQAALEQLQARARDRRAEYRREFVVAMVRRATECPPAEYATASRLLERALALLPDVEGFDRRTQSIIVSDARTAYVTARCDGAAHLVEQGHELRDSGDTAAAIDRFEQALTVLEETDRWVEEDTPGDGSDIDTDRLREVRTRAEDAYVDARSAAIERTIQTGIEQFESERYTAAGERFREAASDTTAAIDRVEGDRPRQRLKRLEQAASQNATTADRATLGTVGDSPSLRDPTDESESGTMSEAQPEPGTDSPVVSTETVDRRPTAIPGAPSLDFDLEFERLDLQESLGTGGDADVYYATVGDGYEIAVKQPRMSGEATVLTDEVDLDRMLDEAETWQQLDSHEHIVSVLDYGSQPLPWIGMEYMDGGHLGTRVGDLPFEQALWTAIATTEAVRHAHRRGVAHLDLKPENILFRSVEDAWDAPKVADWGLSKQLLRHSEGVEGFSPGYAAPEQFDDSYGQTDDITDIYQLGAVFYELFTGQPPFEGDPAQVMRQVLAEDPPAPSTLADLPPALDEVLLRALATDRSNRYEDILYLRDELQALHDEL
jgi:tetratricopeptide (TPR) repeat protein/tRNA A-37 threonylcarbamoyl transferase component Bud32